MHPTPAHVEYVGFTIQGATREYRLRVRQGAGESRDVTCTIPNEAFLSNRVRYQDAPGICFLKIQKELAAAASAAIAAPAAIPATPALHLSITDAELEDYKVQQTPRPPRRRNKPAPPAAD